MDLSLYVCRYVGMRVCMYYTARMVCIDKYAQYALMSMHVCSHVRTVRVPGSGLAVASYLSPVVSCFQDATASLQAS